MRRMISVSTALCLLLSLQACNLSNREPPIVDMAVADDLAVVPGSASAKNTYTRYWQLKDVRSERDLPFTTDIGFSLCKPQKLWLAIFIDPGDVPDKHSVRRLVKEDKGMPRIYDGGCDVVNVIADPKTGHTLISWCSYALVPEGTDVSSYETSYAPDGRPAVCFNTIATKDGAAILPPDEAPE